MSLPLGGAAVPQDVDSTDVGRLLDHRQLKRPLEDMVGPPFRHDFLAAST